MLSLPARNWAGAAFRHDRLAYFRRIAGLTRTETRSLFAIAGVLQYERLLSPPLLWAYVSGRSGNGFLERSGHPRHISAPKWTSSSAAHSSGVSNKVDRNLRNPGSG